MSQETILSLVFFVLCRNLLLGIIKCPQNLSFTRTGFRNQPIVALKSLQICLYTLKQICVLEHDFKRTIYTNEHANVCVNSRADSQSLSSSEASSPSSCFRLTGFSFKSPDSDNFPLNPFRGAPHLTL